MSLTIKTLGCNGLCRSCYENRIRSVSLDTRYDIEAILKTVERETSKEKGGNTVCLHGGEPLLMKFEDIERLLAKVFEVYGHTGMQTNGILISDRIIELFKQYKTSVGVSIDGDTWELNYGRWNAKKLSKEEIQRRTNRVLTNMKKCRDAGLGVSVIALLRKCNASKERLPKLLKFFLRLKEEFGVNSIRTNEGVVYEDKWRQEEELTNEELGHAFCTIADVALASPDIMWLPYRDVVDLVMGYRNATCIFTQCDVWRTASERTIDKDGQVGCCLKGGAAVDGLQVPALDRVGYERSESLRQTPQENGGCKDCRFWFICYGLCPGEGIGNDWRKKSRFCEAWKTLFSHIEAKIKALMPNVITASELYPACPSSEMVQTNLSSGGSTWQIASRKNVEDVRKIQPEKKESEGNRPHGDRPHGDKPHGDGGHGDGGHGDTDHGDHSDASGRRQ